MKYILFLPKHHDKIAMKRLSCFSQSQSVSAVYGLARKHGIPTVTCQTSSNVSWLLFYYVVSAEIKLIFNLCGRKTELI